MNACVELLSPAETLSQLACILRCVEEAEAVRVTALAEYVRACVYQPYYWKADWGLPQPTHTNRILSAVRRDIGFLWKDANELSLSSQYPNNDGPVSGAQDVMRKLRSIGDIVDLGNGLWVPGPTKIVRLTENREAALLVIGGRPFEILETQIAACISCVGCGRFVRPDPMTLRHLRLEYELQSIDHWLGGPVESLSAWTRRIFRSLCESMDPASDVDAGECEIYVPDNLPGKPRGGNWLPIREFSLPPAGLRLCRPSVSKSAMHDRPTYLAVLREDGGRVTFQQLALVPKDIQRRLMFGIEQMQNIQRTVTLEVANRTCCMAMPFKLPEPENRILAFGWPVIKDSNRRAEAFEFSCDLVPHLKQVLARLNVRTETKLSGA